MTEDFIKIINREYDSWKERKRIKDSDNSLYIFLKNYMSKIKWTEKALEKDLYPIYCFYESQEPIYSARTGKKISDYVDLYWNFQQPGYSFGPSDSIENGNNRKKFIFENIDNIIYPPNGKSFANLDVFYKIQAEYVKEALSSDQVSAKKLIIKKYGRK